MSTYWFHVKGEPKMLKLPGVSKFSNGWQYHPKRKYQTKKRSFTIKHKKALLNLRHFFRELVWMANLSIENHHWHLHESKSYVLVPGKSEWARTWKKRKLKKLSPSTSGHGTISSIYYPSSLLINVTSPHTLTGLGDLLSGLSSSILTHCQTQAWLGTLWNSSYLL